MCISHLTPPRPCCKGLLRHLLFQNSIAAHLRLHEVFTTEADDLESAMSYKGSTPRNLDSMDTEKVDLPARPSQRLGALHCLVFEGWVVSNHHPNGRRHAFAAAQSPTDTLGVETKEIWRALYDLACMPRWATTRPGRPDLQPMPLKDAYTRLKRTSLARSMRQQLEHELEIRRRFAEKEAEYAAMIRISAKVLPDPSQPDYLCAEITLHRFFYHCLCVCVWGGGNYRSDGPWLARSGAKDAKQSD